MMNDLKLNNSILKKSNEIKYLGVFARQEIGFQRTQLALQQN